MFQRAPPPTEKRATLPSCHFATHLQNQWKPGARVLLEHRLPPVSSLAGLNLNHSSWLKSYQQVQPLLWKRKTRSRRLWFLQTRMCLPTGSSVLLRPCSHCFLTGPASAWSFVLPFCPPELGWFTFFLCSFMRFMYFHQYQMSSARILTGAPSAGGMTPLHREIPLQSHIRDLSLFFSFSLHVLLPKKGMTLIKKCTLSIKIGMCLSPVACYHSETYLSSVPHFKAA